MRNILISMSITCTSLTVRTFASVSCKKRGYLSGTVKRTITISPYMDIYIRSN